MDNTPNTLKMAGWREWVALPGLGLPAIKAKIDTGARTSTLHAFVVERFRQSGGDWVRFGMHPLQRRESPAITCTAPLLDERMVSDSGGHREMRCVIASDLHLGGEVWPIELTLTNRDSMLFRMLLGREALRGRLLVDPGSSYCFGRKKGAHHYRKALPNRARHDHA